MTNLSWYKLNGTQPSAALAGYGYTVGPAGNRTDVNETMGSRLVHYDYDNRYRLTRETINGPANAIGYQYDFVANRLARTSAGTTGVPAASYGYDANDRLNGSNGDTYDGNGNTVTSGNTTDSYDAENRLVHRCVGDPLFPTATFDLLYDGDGNRMQKVELDSILGQITTVYVVDDRNPTGYAQVLEELVTVNGGATSTRYYTYGHVLISQREAVSGTHFYNQDGHGNVRFLTDTTATISDTYTYDALGILIAQTHVGTPTPNNYLYSGEQFDSDLGLYYNRARYLNTSTGRFWSMDTVEGCCGDPGSLNKYAYAQADPINRIDPDGHDDIGSVMASVSLEGSIQNSWSQVTVPAASSAALRVSGPDITSPLLLTLADINYTFGGVPIDKKATVCGNIFLPGIGNGWDIYPLRDVGFGIPFNFGDRSTIGFGIGGRTVQYSHLGGPAKVYYAGAVNYTLWGRMFRLCKQAFPQAPEYNLSVAIGMAKTYKLLYWGGDQSRDAAAFVRLGYVGSDPSDVALPLGTNSKNIAAVVKFQWKWIGLHED